jgi:hypothetical protein
MTDEDRIAEAMRLHDKATSSALAHGACLAVNDMKGASQMRFDTAAARAALEAHLRAALAPAMQDAEDAARYRWLRDHMWAQALNTTYALPICWGVDYPGQAGESMDAAIDAARAPQEGSQP